MSALPADKIDSELRALTDSLDVWRRVCHARYCLTNWTLRNSQTFMKQCKSHLELCVEAREYFRYGRTVSVEQACAEVAEVLGYCNTNG